MSVEKHRHLEQALLAVIAAAGQRGLNVDELCARAVGGLMSERYWPWAEAGSKYGAADEIDKALEVLLHRRSAPEPETPASTGQPLRMPEHG